MAAAKKKKILTYKGKPLLKCGERIYYGNLEDKLILALDVVESEKNKDIQSSKKIKIQLMDNTGDLGAGQVYRKAERENLYKALDIGEWWLQDALQTFEGYTLKRISFLIDILFNFTISNAVCYSVEYNTAKFVV